MADARPGISETAVRIAEWLECDVYLEHDQSLLIKEGGKGVCAALVDYWAATILRSGSETPHILFHSELKEAGSNHILKFRHGLSSDNFPDGLLYSLKCYHDDSIRGGPVSLGLELKPIIGGDFLGAMAGDDFNHLLNQISKLIEKIGPGVYRLALNVNVGIDEHIPGHAIGICKSGIKAEECVYDPNAGIAICYESHKVADTLKTFFTDDETFGRRGYNSYRCANLEQYHLAAAWNPEEFSKIHKKAIDNKLA